MLFVPGDPGHQALVIVCLFGVILGGINLTSVYKPAFYGFVLPALVPLDRARRARKAIDCISYRRGHAGRARLHSRLPATTSTT